METVLLVVAGGAVGLAILIAVAKKMKSSPMQNTQTGFGAMGVSSVKPKAPPPMPAKKQRNKRGWRAPSGHYFNDDDELFTDAGLIIDMMMIASLCGESYESDPPAECTAGPECCSEAVGSETIASRPVESEVSASTSFSDLHTADSTPESSYGGSDSCDSGGDSGDCGD